MQASTAPTYHAMRKIILILFMFALSVSAQAQDITRFEYFFDTDPGYGAGTITNVTPATTITDFDIPVATSSLSTGFHKLYIRAQNATNQWTHTHIRSFFIVPLTTPSPDITQIEYFVDTDPGIGLATQVSFTAAPTITNLPIDISAVPLTSGFHKLYVRSKTSDGQWTHTHTRSFYIANVGVAQNLVKFEYFFDTDPGFDSGNAVAITPAAPSVTNQDVFADATGLAIGSHTIYVRAKDSGGEWTQVSTGAFSVTAAVLPTITSFTPTSGPVGTTVTITGTNFDATPANNIVAFNGTTAVVTASTATSITTTVPVGATTGKISVTVAGNTATSTTDFTVTQNFITQWNLATAGSGATQLSFGTATSGIVNYTWQEISTGTATGSGSWSGSPLTITGLPAGATIRLLIAPANFQRININNGGDKNRLIQVEQWGNTAWTSMSQAFYGCANLQVTATDTPNLLGITNMSYMFFGCTNLNSPGNIGSWNTATVTNMSEMFVGTTAFNQNIGGWNTGAVTNMNQMFRNASAFNQDLGAWTLNPAVDLGSMLDNSGMNCSNYSATLIGWNANPSTPDNRTLGVNGLQYGTNAVAARTNLTATKGWTITGDTPSGAVCSASSITITTQPSDFITCVGGIATFNTAATGATNIIYRWQFSIDGVAPFTDINNGGGYSGATTATLTVNTTGNFGLGRYRCRINGDLAAEVITNDEGLFINPIPTAPTATNTSRCGPGSVTLTAAGGSNGQYRWYTAATGGTAITGEVNSSYVTPAVTTSTTYFVAINNGSCESLRSPVVATINIPPAIPAITSSITPVGNALTICSTTSLTLTAPSGFASYSWSTGATTQQISVSTSGSYSVTVTDAGGCVSPASAVLVVTVIPAPCNNQAPVISTTTTSTVIEGQATINLLDLISDTDNNLVPSSLAIAQQPTSGASATITNGVLEIDYKGVSFSGRDQVTIRVCDVFGECTQQVLEIDVIGDIEVYNGISPNNDNQNDIFLIQYIELLPDTQQNKVSIFNRWGSKVFEIDNYNNTSNVFRGLSNNGNELPSGTYFYKIEFTSGRKSETGYLTLRKP